MRVQGTEGVALVECINPDKDKWRVRWDVRPNTGTDEQGNPRTGINYEETEFLYKPTISEIKKVVLDWYNQQIDLKITSGFVWRDMPVWLSSENQFNYKAAYDLAVQSGGLNLPIRFKFGTDDGPVYYTFNSVDILSEFYVASAAFIQYTLDQGWIVKDGVDWTPYL